MYFPHEEYDFETGKNLVNIANIAKKFLKKIPCKKDFDEIIEQVPLSPTEYQIIKSRFKEFKSVIQISNELYMSIPTVYQKQRKALGKVYSFLKYRKYI